jgi:hypothetical protein
MSSRATLMPTSWAELPRLVTESCSRPLSPVGWNGYAGHLCLWAGRWPSALSVSCGDAERCQLPNLVSTRCPVGTGRGDVGQPDHFIQVIEVRARLTGKKMELPMRRILRGPPVPDQKALTSKHPDTPAQAAIQVRHGFPGRRRSVISAVAASSSRIRPHHSEDGRDRVASDLGSVARAPGGHSDQTFSVAG